MESTGNHNRLLAAGTVAEGGQTSVTINQGGNQLAAWGLCAVLLVQVALFAYVFAIRHELKAERITHNSQLLEEIEKATTQAINIALLKKTP